MRKAAKRMAEDKRVDLLDRILAAHQSFYDIRRDCLFEGRTFPAFAEYHTYGEKYVLVKRAKLWEVNTHDFMFFECVDELDEARLAEEISFMKEKAIRKVNAGPNHMSSALSLVIIANHATEEALKLAKKTRFHKEYCFGFRGWTDLRLAVVDLSLPASKGVVVNNAGKQLKEVISNNLALIEQGPQTRKVQE